MVSSILLKFIFKQKFKIFSQVPYNGGLQLFNVAYLGVGSAGNILKA